MAIENVRTASVCLNETDDPRTRLVREKYFSLRPKPLEHWLWKQSLPQAAERVFWLHWEEGMKSRDWCSEIPVRQVAALCCIDPSTVTRAYQVLKTLGLIRRADPGRDLANPFQQATAITEVRLPPGLLAEVSRAPNRRVLVRAQAANPAVDRIAEGPPTVTAPVRDKASLGTSDSQESPTPTAATYSPRPTRESHKALWGRASQAEKGRFFSASRNGQTRIAFDPDTQLTSEDQARLLAQLGQMARPAPAPVRIAAPSTPTAAVARNRSLSPLELARTRKQISKIVPSEQLAETFREVIWAVEEGALNKFERPLALNIALKKLREGAWTRPHRMPLNWMRQPARPEMCGAA